MTDDQQRTPEGAARTLSEFYDSRMSKPARWTMLLAITALVVAEVIAYLAYRDTIDGVFANVAIALYGVLVLVAIWVVDRVFDRIRRRGLRQRA